MGKRGIPGVPGQHSGNLFSPAFGAQRPDTGKSPAAFRSFFHLKMIIGSYGDTR
jgi:hypothetical protein